MAVLRLVTRSSSITLATAHRQAFVTLTIGVALTRATRIGNLTLPIDTIFVGAVSTRTTVGSHRTRFTDYAALARQAISVGVTRVTSASQTLATVRTAGRTLRVRANPRMAVTCVRTLRPDVARSAQTVVAANTGRAVFGICALGVDATR